MLNIFIFMTSSCVALLTANPALAQPTRLEFSKWTEDINVPDPVAISFDNEGRAFVTQTQRRKANDLDIRRNSDWIPNDLSFQSVTERRAFYYERLAPGLDNAKRVQDLNNDGSHDYHDLTVLKEIVRRYEDTDGDGIADTATIFQEGFNSEVSGIAAGILYHGDSVYVTAIPDVWRLSDHDGDGNADTEQIIATGFGPHIAYAGHDMHGLTVGPDGKIYWSVGDKGISPKIARGRNSHFPNQGGVMRCNPDGSDFEVFAHGLRNIQELAFDQFGNLFGVDNDADKPNERERFIYIVKGMDAGWRCNYQYRSDEYNPWTAERLWYTHFNGQAAYIIPPIQHSINGPAGFAFNPGTALSPEYHNYFFLTGAPNGQQIAFQVRKKGASFEMINEHEIGNSISLVGINFAPDGALYGVDWGGGYPLNQSGAIWRIDDPDHSKSKIRREVQTLLSTNVAQKANSELVALLAHADQRIRLRAQFELVKRKAIIELSETAMADDVGQLSRIHSIWGLGQLTHEYSQFKEPNAAIAVLSNLLRDYDEEVVCQTARVISDAHAFDGALLLSLIKDTSQRVQFYGMQALAAHPTHAAAGELIAIAERLEPSQSYLRHGVCMALAACASESDLAKLAKHVDVGVRLAAVVSLRHKHSREVERFLTDEEMSVAEEAARAIHDDFSIIEAMPALAQSLAKTVRYSDIFLRRSINANFRLGSPVAFLELIEFAANEDAPLPMRLDAMEALALWSEPPVLDRVTGRFRKFDKRSVDRYGNNASSGLLNNLLFNSNPAIQAAAMEIHRSINLPVDDSMLKKLASSPNATPELAVESLNLLHAQKSPRLGVALKSAISSSHDSVRIRAYELMVAQKSPSTFETMETAYHEGSPALRQTITELMGQLASPSADAFLLRQTRNAAGIADAVDSIELLSALNVRRKHNSAIAAKLDELHEWLSSAATGSPELAFAMCMSGGDVAAGQELFNSHLQAQCVRCHRVGQKGSTVGPNLKGIGGKRNPGHLLRAIVAPSADIEPKYRSVVVLLASGKTLTGVKVKETNAELLIADSKGKVQKIATDDIDDIVEQNVSIMPEVAKTLTLGEIRNLVAYLTSLK